MAAKQRIDAEMLALHAQLDRFGSVIMIVLCTNRLSARFEGENRDRMAALDAKVGEVRHISKLSRYLVVLKSVEDIWCGCQL